jgi:membrane-bound lytic murein transglycosylase B
MRAMGWRMLFAAGLVLALVLGPAPAVRADERGWSYLVDKLCRDGVPRDRVLRVFRDDRIDAFDGLYFSLNPRESHSLYRPLRTGRTAYKAQSCLDTHREAFEAAQRTYGVPASLVASIIQVESGCGANTGRSRILPALARLSMAAEPGNLERNVDRLTFFDSGRSPADIASYAHWRANYLEDLFYPEVKAVFDLSEQMRVDPLELRGSGSGALGIPQFLPRSYLWYGVDGNQDGSISLYDPNDAIPSCAKYLQHYGWKAGLSRREQRNVIWGYNRSDAYIDTVLWLADEVESPSPEPEREPVQVAKKSRSRGRSSRRTVVHAKSTSRKTASRSKATKASTRTKSTASSKKKKKTTTTHAHR